jgi:hypothetical protein
MGMSLMDTVKSCGAKAVGSLSIGAGIECAQNSFADVKKDYGWNARAERGIAESMGPEGVSVKNDAQAPSRTMSQEDFFYPNKLPTAPKPK